jgi:hypothetical protein
VQGCRASQSATIRVVAAEAAASPFCNPLFPDEGESGPAYAQCPTRPPFSQRAADAAKAELPAVEKEVARLEKAEAANYAKMLTP